MAADHGRPWWWAHLFTAFCDSWVSEDRSRIRFIIPEPYCSRIRRIHLFTKKMVDFSLSIPLIVSSSLAAPAGSYLNVHIDLKPFLMIMAVVLALAAIRMLLSRAAEVETIGMEPWKKVLAGIGIGACIGLMGGMLGIGGGVFMVPLLIYVLKTPTKIAAASSTFIVCFSSFTGFLGYASMEKINWWFILPAAVASLAGGQAG